MGLRILVVDDDAGSAAALARLLEHGGHVVAAARSLADALAQAAHLPTIDLLISDINLPDGDGCTLLRVLGGRRGGAPRFAIALTGHGDEQWREECERAGYGTFLTKPLEFDRLRDAVAKLQPLRDSTDIR